VLNYLKIIVLHLEHLDSLGERQANRLMSWVRLYNCDWRTNTGVK